MAYSPTHALELKGYGENKFLACIISGFLPAFGSYSQCFKVERFPRHIFISDCDSWVHLLYWIFFNFAKSSHPEKPITKYQFSKMALVESQGLHGLSGAVMIKGGRISLLPEYLNFFFWNLTSLMIPTFRKFAKHCPGYYNFCNFERVFEAVWLSLLLICIPGLQSYLLCFNTPKEGEVVLPLFLWGKHRNKLG